MTRHATTVPMESVRGERSPEPSPNGCGLAAPYMPAAGLSSRATVTGRDDGGLLEAEALELGGEVRRRTAQDGGRLLEAEAAVAQRLEGP